METKAQLRKRMKAIRDGISPILRQRKNEQIMNALLREDWYADAKIICVYAAIASEVDLCNFCQRAWNDSKKLYFPKVFGEEMEFYEVDDFTCLKEGCFHVMEPDLENYDLKSTKIRQNRYIYLYRELLFRKSVAGLDTGKAIMTDICQCIRHSYQSESVIRNKESRRFQQIFMICG